MYKGRVGNGGRARVDIFNIWASNLEFSLTHSENNWDQEMERKKSYRSEGEKKITCQPDKCVFIF
jgi:hypothetical protein